MTRKAWALVKGRNVHQIALTRRVLLDEAFFSGCLWTPTELRVAGFRIVRCTVEWEDKP